jgi:hypothetical protein
MEHFREHGLDWEVTWNITRNGQVYTQIELNFLKDHTHCKSLKNLAESLKRKVSAIASKLEKMGILNFNSGFQTNWNTIHKYQSELSIYNLQKNLDRNTDSFSDKETSSWERYNNEVKIHVSNEETYISDTKIVDGSYSLKLNNTKEQKMKRRTVIVELFDDNQGLDVKHSRVLCEEVVTESDNDNSIIQQMLLESGSDSVGKAIKDHNLLRSETVDEKILQNTGNKVMLREVKIEDLRWSIR